jgi:hypothetical protein
MIRTLVAFFVLVHLGGAVAHGGVINGTVFTAEHEDSLAVNVPVSLAFQDSTGEFRQIAGRTDRSGRFVFEDLSTDPMTLYRLRIDFRGQDFSGAPMRFEPGQTEIGFDVLLADELPPGSSLPAGHPPVGGPPLRTRPVAQRPLHTVCITLAVVLLFVALALAIPQPRRGRGRIRLSADARRLVRDIAGLDHRYADGVIGPEEYRKVRASLMDRLRSQAAGPTGS